MREYLIFVTEEKDEQKKYSQKSCELSGRAEIRERRLGRQTVF